MKIKAVLFDEDDTIYHSFAECDRAGMQAACVYAQEKLGVSAKQFEEAFTRGKEKIRALSPGLGSSHNRTLFAQAALESLGINPIVHAEAIFEAYWQAMMGEMVLFGEIKALFAKLRELGIKIVIVTNMTAEIQMRKLRILGVEEDIDCFISSEEAGIDKPDKGIFAYTLAKLGLQKDEVLMVGDSFAHDIRGAQAAGIAALWFNWRGEAAPANGGEYMQANSSAQAADKIFRLCGIDTKTMEV